MPLPGYSYESYPLVAMVGMVSKLLVFDVKTFVLVKSIRVLVSNWQMFKGLQPIGV